MPSLPVDPFGPAPAAPAPPADRAGKSAESLASETAWFRAFALPPTSAAPPSSAPEQADAEDPVAGAPQAETPPFQARPFQAPPFQAAPTPVQPGPPAPGPFGPEHAQPFDPNAAWQAGGPASPTAPPPAPPRQQDTEQKNLHGDPLFRRMSRGVLRAVGGTGAQDIRQLEELTNRLRIPVPTCRQIAVTSIRGGAGKTTVAALMSTALGQHRTDRILAVDADSGLGSLPLRLGAQTERSLHDLATAYPRSWQEASNYLAQVAERLWVLSGTSHGAVTGELELDTYQTAVGALNRYFSAYIIDCGAGIVTQPQRGILTTVHAQVMVTPATPDGVSSAQSTLQWLQANGYAELLPRTVIALVTHSPHADTDVDRARTALSAGGTPVVHVPYDRHLAAGKAVDFSRIGEDTRMAALRIAAETLTRASTA
jgi:MinD-like ATPase involved in chromosome partitioning or flagellar assembly